MGGNLVSAGTNAGITKTHQIRQSTTSNTINKNYIIADRCIGGGVECNPRLGIYRKFLTYQTSTGVLYNRYI